MLLAGGGVAYADDIFNNLDGTVDSVAELMPLNVGGANGSTTLAVAPTGSDGKSGCNLTGATTLTLNLSSSNPAVATVSPSSVTFTSCGDTKSLTVTPVSAGSATVSASQASNNSGGTFNLAPATFTVNVVAPAPSNTAPKLNITGVTAGASYPKGAVPAATCSVTDVEDGNSSFPATFGAVSGADGAGGVGTQEASCSYTDKGGLTVASSVTYGITDGSAPVISYTLSPTTPDGSNDWYKNAVALHWTVTESDSLSTLSKTGCQDQTIAADQVATDFSCSASSSGGTAATQTVNLKKDGTAPTVGFTDATGTAGTNGWYTSDVDATFTGSDATSGLLTSSQKVTSSGEGPAVQVNSPSFTDIAGNTAAEGAASHTFKIDKTAPEVSYADETGTAGTNGWYTSDVQTDFSATDLISGPLTATQTVTSAGEGEAVTVQSPAFTDNAGNTTAAGAVSRSYKIDKTAPDVSYADVAFGTLGLNDWYVSDVEARFTATDKTSGLAASSQTATSSGEGLDVLVPSPAFVDNAGNTTPTGATTKSFRIDKTAPKVAYSGATTQANSNGWYNTDVTATFTGTDDVSGPASATQSRTTTGEGGTVTVNSPAFTDGAGNTTPEGATSATFKVDKTAPAVSFDSVVGDSFFGSTAAKPTCTATDSGGSGLSGSCAVTGYDTKNGTHTLKATATDLAGNTTTVEQTYTVKAWTLKGFYQPVDMNGVLNTVKNGSTVPAKFEIFAGATELTDPALAKFTTKQVACSLLSPIDDIETTATGNTSLRYDATSGQFIYNWKTPATAGSCYTLTMTANDGSFISANFKLK